MTQSGALRSEKPDKNPSDTLRRRSIERRGRWAEALAVLLLIAKGYRILSVRAQTPAGEIDIIARRRDRLAFVEVKQRPTFDDAAMAVTWTKARRLRAAATAWLQRHPQYRHDRLGIDRCDVVGLTKVRHRPDALQIDGGARSFPI